MEITVEVTRQELSQLEISKDRLQVIINEALDKAIKPDGAAANLNPNVFIKVV